MQSNQSYRYFLIFYKRFFLSGNQLTSNDIRYRTKSKHRGLLRFFLNPSNTLKISQGRNLECQIFIQHIFKIFLYWCFDLIRHNIGTQLKLNKYIFDISIPFCFSQNLQSPNMSSIMFTCQYEVDFLRAI